MLHTKSTICLCCMVCNELSLRPRVQPWQPPTTAGAPYNGTVTCTGLRADRHGLVIAGIRSLAAANVCLQQRQSSFRLLFQGLTKLPHEAYNPQRAMDVADPVAVQLAVYITAKLEFRSDAQAPVRPRPDM